MKKKNNPVQHTLTVKISSFYELLSVRNQIGLCLITNSDPVYFPITVPVFWFLLLSRKTVYVQ